MILNVVVHNQENLTAQSYLSHSWQQLARYEASLPTQLSADIVFSRLQQRLSETRPELLLWQTEPLPDVTEMFDELEEDIHRMRVRSDRGNWYGLSFEEQRFSDLEQREPLIMTGTLLLLFLTSTLALWIAVLIGKRIASPLNDLAEALKKTTAQTPLPGHARPDEIGQLSRKLSELITRNQQFLQREKEFTRHASHELRTPVAVVQSNVSLLKLHMQDNEALERPVKRIETACNNMKKLIDVFLLLGREEAASVSTVNVYTIVNQQLANEHTAQHQAKTVAVTGEYELDTQPELFIILMANLVRNALAYSQTHIQIAITSCEIMIENDTLESLSDDPASMAHPTITGFGYGTEIIERICETLHFQRKISIKEGLYQVRIRW